MKKYSWISLSLYCHHESWIFFLTKGVHPFVNEVIQKGYSNEFIFLRSWLRGSHIILIFKGDKEVLDEKLKPWAVDYFKSFFEKYPSKNEKVKLPLGHWFLPYPNNSVVINNFRFHQLEIIKLSGGVKASKLAYKQLQLSSRIVLDIISSNPQMDLEGATSVGVLLIFSFVRATGMSLDVAKHFSEELFENALPQTKTLPKGFEQEKDDLQQSIKVLRKSLAKSFKDQEGYIVSYLQNVWNAMSDHQAFEEEWLNTWVSEVKKITKSIKQLQQADEFMPTEHFKVNKKINIPIDEQERWTVYQYYIRHLCLQLGIHKANELNLFFTIKEVFRTFTEEPAHSEESEATLANV
jgi:hypothetical protein